jgi:hypothetical protein
VYQQKIAKKNKGKQKSGWAIAAVILLLAAGAYFLRDNLSGNKEIQKSADNLVANNVTAVNTTTPEQEEDANKIETTSESATVQPLLTNGKAGKEKNTLQNKTVTKAATTNPTPPIKENKIELTNPAPEKNSSENESTGSNTPTTETGETKEKKSIGQKIDGFFEKLKTKKEEENTKAKQPIESPNTAGERTSERRDEPVELENVASAIDVSSNQDGENWMTGIQNLKLTVRNRGNVAVSAAVVAVRYYNEQNELLETWNVQVKNIPAKKSVTVAAPGNRLADHIDYELLSAVGGAQ